MSDYSVDPRWKKIYAKLTEEEIENLARAIEDQGHVLGPEEESMEPYFKKKIFSQPVPVEVLDDNGEWISALAIAKNIGEDGNDVSLEVRDPKTGKVWTAEPDRIK